MRLLAIMVAVGALLDAVPTPALAQSGRLRRARPSRPSRPSRSSSRAPRPPRSDTPVPGARMGASTDFVIVGGGTAGCVLAARLCENLPEASVVLLERGGPRTEEQELLVRAPRLFGSAWNDPQLTEGWQSQPNPGFGGRTIQQLTGNTLGGSSTINGVQWTKPALSTFDTDTWAFTGVPADTPPSSLMALRASTVSDLEAHHKQAGRCTYLLANSA